jgi:hypothetical protein
VGTKDPIQGNLELEEDTTPVAVGQVRLVGGAFKAMDSAGVFDLRSGSGLSEAAHKALRQLIHFIDDGPGHGFASGAFKETVGGVFPTAETWFVVGSTPPAGKIVELLTTWASAKITQEIWRIYDTDGSTVLATVTDAITYSGVFETTRTRTIT